MHTQALSCRQHSVCRRTSRCSQRSVRTVAALLMMLCLSFGATADGQKAERHKGQGQPAAEQQRHNSAQKASGISPQQAVSIAKQRQQGKVLSVKRSNGSYKVKMLHQGQVRYVTVAAE